MTRMIGGATAPSALADLDARVRPALLAARPPAIDAQAYQARLEKARRLTADLGAGALLITAGSSLRYFTGVPWGATERLVALLLPVDGPARMICPGFELGSLQAVLQIDAPIHLWQEDEDPAALVAGLLAADAPLALDPQAPFGVHTALRRARPDLALLDAQPVTQGCRGIKSTAELALLAHAKRLTLEVQRAAATILAPGISTGAVKRFIDQAHRLLGADDGSYFCAVQFDIATAYPHGLPGEQHLAENDLVLIDTGCRVEGYHSDITRTYIYGEPTAEQRRIWVIEHEAQAAAFAAARPGVACEDVDAAARAVLERHGLGPGYALPGLPHRTGHGIGLDIHEGPYLVRGDRTPLAPGMCFSNEPMIVIPDRFGIRLEDHFHVTEQGAAWFTVPSAAIDQPFA